MAIKSTLGALLERSLPVGLHGAVKMLGTEIRLHRYHRRGVKRAKTYVGKKGLQLNIGCGSNLKAGWINIDLSPKAELTLDMREPVPFDDGAAAIIYSEHFFEHLDYPRDAKRFLRECFRVLQTAGLFRLGVPDTVMPLLDYAGVGDGSWLEACKTGGYPRPDWCKTSLDHINYHFRQEKEHRYAYDFDTIETILRETGFVEIARSDFDPGLDTKTRQRGTLYVNAKKPPVVH